MRRLALPPLVFDGRRSPRAAGTTEAAARQGASSEACPSGALEIKMADIKFDPKDATASISQPVCWVNEDTIEHNAVADPSGEFESELFGKGKTFTATVDAPGEIPYVCTVHPGYDRDAHRGALRHAARSRAASASPARRRCPAWAAPRGPRGAVDVEERPGAEQPLSAARRRRPRGRRRAAGRRDAADRPWWVPRSLHGAHAKWPSVSRAPVEFTRASGNAATAPWRGRPRADADQRLGVSGSS